MTACLSGGGNAYCYECKHETLCLRNTLCCRQNIALVVCKGIGSAFLHICVIIAEHRRDNFVITLRAKPAFRIKICNLIFFLQEIQALSASCMYKNSSVWKVIACSQSVGISHTTFVKWSQKEQVLISTSLFCSRNCCTFTFEEELDCWVKRILISRFDGCHVDFSQNH